MKHLIAIAVALVLGGCGVSETAATTATMGKAKAEEAKNAQQTLDRVENRLDAAQELDKKRREEALGATY